MSGSYKIVSDRRRILREVIYLGVGALVVGDSSDKLGRVDYMLCSRLTEHATDNTVAIVLLDFRAHPETAGPVA